MSVRIEAPTARLGRRVRRDGHLTHPGLSSLRYLSPNAHPVPRSRLPPTLPELLRRADRRVTCLLAVEREEKVSEVEELRNVLFVLVADQLAARLTNVLGGPLVLNDDKGDAVHEGDDIEATGLEAARALHLHLGGDVVGVVRGILPVDVAERVRLRVTADLLRDARPEHKQVVDLLVRASKSLNLIRVGMETPDGFVRIFQVEPVAAAAVREAVDREEAVREDVVQNDIAKAAATVAKGVGLGEWRVSERDEELQRGDLGLVLLGGIEGHVMASLDTPLCFGVPGLQSSVGHQVRNQSFLLISKGNEVSREVPNPDITSPQDIRYPALQSQIRYVEDGTLDATQSETESSRTVRPRTKIRSSPGKVEEVLQEQSVDSGSRPKDCQMIAAYHVRACLHNHGWHSDVIWIF